MKYSYLTFIFLLLFWNCKNDHQHDNHSHHHGDNHINDSTGAMDKKHASHEHEHSTDQQKHKKDHQGHGHANHHMHKTPVAELIMSFDSKERARTQKPNQVISLLGNIKGKKIIDIGSGSGYFTFRMADKGANVIAGDVDDKFHEHIKSKMKENEVYNEHIEIRKLPYDSPFLFSGEVHHALIVNTYHHIENRVRYFKEVKAGLKSEGMLMVVDFKKQHFKEEVEGPPYEMRMSKDFVIDELKQSGFVKFEANETLLPYQYIIMALK